MTALDERVTADIALAGSAAVLNVHQAACAAHLGLLIIWQIASCETSTAMIEAGEVE